MGTRPIASQKIGFPMKGEKLDFHDESGSPPNCKGVAALHPCQATAYSTSGMPSRVSIP